ncbi:ABC transporter substrate-binding protein [Rhizobium pusense]|uniref:ABC transporter substrate-binding protein n=2 Tax=Agrobacterium TaxID=357 RepID=UPI000D198F4D|nr:ABC transporter substrate-binding protein [Agrobacterium pusense]MDH0911149.1 ABC transporter substrate-binding protein [Agrobacterium pusense]MDH1097218.1 ABC transporter substrate-binding protein [Agrobacterium pusense]MDH1113698.1 ABC transporter substrate-binding protein [Agrobacterium pusense]MDH2193220.1 ABC transporter substrate-binding protein [Agrobacterium pusense]
MKMILAAATLSLMASAAMADTTITVQYAYPELFDTTQKEMVAAFNKAHPEIKVEFRSAYKDYEDAAQRVLREGITGNTPDVTFQGLNRVRVLADKNIAVALDGFIANEKGFDAAGYHEGMRQAGAVNGKVYGLPFAISLPIVYYNMDLVKKAGLDENSLPKTWDEIAALGKKIKDQGQADGVETEWAITGNWLWQALVFANGGTMLNADETKVAFTDDAGKKALSTLAKLVTEAKSPNMTPNEMLAAFAAGKLGMMITTTARVNAVTKQIGGKFELKTGNYPDLKQGVSRLPAGGNVAIITAKDKEKQKAAWEFLKFATGPEGGAIMVKTTGYMAPNNKAADLLKDFYVQNPNQAVALSQLPYLTGWYAFPGDNGLKITDVIKDRIQSVMDGSRAKEPDAVLKDMASDVQALLPRR